jgi:hypothetical protein
MGERFNAICLVDKVLGDRHPFVDCALKDIVKGNADYFHIIYSIRKPSALLSNLRMLLPRRGVARYINFPLAVLQIFFRLQYAPNEKNILVVRNEPVYLAAAVLVKLAVKLIAMRVEVVFQSSYPHERFSGSAVQRSFTISLLKLCFCFVDRFIAVSKTGCERLSRLGAKSCNSFAIPLYIEKIRKLRSSRPLSGGMRFVYVGSTESDRELDVVVNAFEKFSKLFPSARLSIYGRVSESKNFSAILYRGFVPRDTLLKELSSFDFGLVYIPPVPQFEECSPTKLGDYMSAGVIPLGNTEIYGVRSVIQAFSTPYDLPTFSEKDIFFDLCFHAKRSENDIQETRTRMHSFCHDNYTYHGRSELILSAVLGSSDTIDLT